MAKPKPKKDADAPCIAKGTGYSAEESRMLDVIFGRPADDSGDPFTSEETLHDTSHRVVRIRPVRRMRRP